MKPQFNSFSLSWVALSLSYTNEVQESTRYLESLNLGFLLLPGSLPFQDSSPVILSLPWSSFCNFPNYSQYRIINFKVANRLDP